MINFPQGVKAVHEQAPRAKGWEEWSHWLENVFWYHYKWYYFVGVFAAVLLISSVVSFVTKVDWDWTVPYVHVGEADKGSAAAVKKALTAAGSDMSGNGKVQIKVEEYPETGDPGRKDLLGLLRESDNVLFVLDGETLGLYQALGYFSDAVPLGEGLWAATHDAPVTPFTLEEYKEYGYTQEQIDDSNAYMARQHADRLAAAAEMLRSFQNQ